MENSEKLKMFESTGKYSCGFANILSYWREELFNDMNFKFTTPAKTGRRRLHQASFQIVKIHSCEEI